MSGKKSTLFIVTSGLFVLCLTVITPALAATKERVLYSFCAAQLCPGWLEPRVQLGFRCRGKPVRHGRLRRQFELRSRLRDGV